jgi:Rieske Fe-S protein
MVESDRRGFLGWVLGGVGLLVSYAVFAGYAIAYLFPVRPPEQVRRLFVGRREDFPPGATRSFVDPKARTLLIRADADGIRAFDTRCPHLGCKVHWEPEEDRFFCPCHQGVFNRDGVAVSGPPADAGQSLGQADIEVEAGGSVFLKVKA